MEEIAELKLDVVKVKQIIAEMREYDETGDADCLSTFTRNEVMSARGWFFTIRNGMFMFYYKNGERFDRIPEKAMIPIYTDYLLTSI